MNAHMEYGLGKIYYLDRDSKFLLSHKNLYKLIFKESAFYLVYHYVVIAGNVKTSCHDRSCGNTNVSFHGLISYCKL